MTTDAKPPGFGFLDAVMVAATLGILANVAFPLYSLAVRYAQASAVLEDARRFRSVVVDYHARTGTWPPDRGPGEEPPELTSYLAGEMKWENANFDYDWEYWVSKDGSPRFPQRGARVGLSVKSSDRVLLWLLTRMWDSGATSASGSRLTFVFESLAP